MSHFTIVYYNLKPMEDKSMAPLRIEKNGNSKQQ